MITKRKIKSFYRWFRLQSSWKRTFGSKRKISFENFKTLGYFKNPKKHQRISKRFSKSLLVAQGPTTHYSPKGYSQATMPRSNADFYLLDAVTAPRIIKDGVASTYFGIRCITLFLRPALFFRLLKQGKYLYLGVKKWGKFYMIFENLRPKKANSNARYYIPIDYTRKEFLRLLHTENIRSVLLRWFDILDDFEGSTSEDIDLLVADDAISRIRALMNTNIGVLPVDLYSLSGLPGSSYAGLPYVPFQFGKQLLGSRVLHKEGFYIPSKEAYLKSFLYHIVYQKSISSGLPISEEDTEAYTNNPEHDYPKYISEALAGTPFENSLGNLTLSNLHQFLKEQQCSPSYDLLLKLSKLRGRDPWYEKLIDDVETRFTSQFSFQRGITVFLIREKAYELMDIETIREYIDSYGFEIILEGNIQGVVRERAISSIRGGNWSKGPYAISGGYPMYYFLLYDPFQVKPRGKILQQYPNLENRKILTLKNAMRALFVAEGEPFNGVHSSDNFYESVDYLEILLEDKERIQLALQKCREIEQTYEGPYEVIKNFSRNANRAKVELVRYGNGVAIQKTFKENKLRYLEREVLFLKRFGDHPCIPKLYESGANHFLIEFKENYKLASEPGVRLTSGDIVQLRRVLKEVFQAGITLMDVNPSNVLVGASGICLIDFEFATPYVEKPQHLADAWELSRIPENYSGDLPKGHQAIENAYDLFWKSKLKLTKKQFLDSSLFSMALLRKLNRFLFIRLN